MSDHQGLCTCRTFSTLKFIVFNVDVQQVRSNAKETPLQHEHDPEHLFFWARWLCPETFRMHQSTLHVM